MIIALDFDRTLFDTDCVLSLIRERGLEAQIGDPSVYTVIDPAPFLYDDVMPFLHGLPSSYTAYVVSAVTARYGPLSEAYQRDKIIRTGVAALVRDVVLTGESKVAALETLAADFPNDDMVFVDDMVDHLVAVHEALPRVHCIYMERAGAKRNSTMLVPNNMKTVHTLPELLQELARQSV
jgi:hypothetical protein